MSSYSGEIKHGTYKFHYSLFEEKHELEISGAEYEDVKQWYIKNRNRWIKLSSFDSPEIIIKISQEEPSWRRGIFVYKIDDCFVMWNIKDGCKDEIHRIAYYSDVLDCFYRPKNRMSNISKELRAYSELRGRCLPGIKTHRFVLDTKELRLIFRETVRHNPYEVRDIEIHNALIIESEEALTYDEIVNINTIVKRFLSFVSNSRNISISKIEINNDSYWRCSTSYAYGHYVTNSPKKHTPVRLALDYVNISSKIGDILELIYKNDICFISLFQYESGKIGTVDIMNICAAFEYQFKIAYPNYKNTKFEHAKTEVVNNIKGLINNKKAQNKNVDEYKEIMQFVKVYNDTLLHRLEYAFAGFKKFISKYTDTPELYLGEDYNAIPKRIKNARNALDHGSKKNEVFAGELISTVLVRIVTYFMILKSAGLTGKKLARCMNNLFPIPLVVK